MHDAHLPLPGFPAGLDAGNELRRILDMDDGEDSALDRELAGLDEAGRTAWLDEQWNALLDREAGVPE